MVLRNVGWALLQRWGQQGSSILIFFVLAGLLGSEAIGLLAFVNVLYLLGQLLVNGGYSEAIVQAKEMPAERLEALFRRMCLRAGAVALTLGGGGLAVYVAGSHPLLGLLLLAHGPAALLRPFIEIHGGLANRSLRFKQVARISLQSSLVGDLLALLLALHGWGVWSLVTALYAKAMLLSLLYLPVNTWRPRLPGQHGSLGEVHSFSGNVLRMNLLSFVAHRVDQLIVGAILGFESLGIYSLAIRLMQTVDLLLMESLNQVFFSVFSRLKETRERMLELFLAMQHIICFLTFPAFAGMAVVGPLVLASLLGPEWARSGDILLPLALALTFKSAVLLIYPVQLGSGNSRNLMVAAAISAVLMVVLSSATALFGTVAVAYGVALRFLGSGLVHLVMVNRSFAFPNRGLLQVFLVNALPTSLMATASGWVLRVVEPAGWVSATGAAILTGVLAYALLALVRLRRLKADLATVRSFTF
jgi:O-antigen/teichoic acid export membrane protein